MTETIIEIAEQIAREAHCNQKRWDGSPYIEHPKRIAELLDDNDWKIVGWLHDVLEDTDVTSNYLLERGISPKLVKSIETLTRRKNENYYDFIIRISSDKIASIVKLVDIKDNLNDNLKEGSLKDKYRLALYVLAERNGVIHG